MTPNDSHESPCQCGGNCQSCHGKFSLVRTCALILFAAIAFALASGKLKPFQSPDSPSGGEQPAQSQLPLHSNSTDHQTTEVRKTGELPFEKLGNPSSRSNRTQGKTADDAGMATPARPSDEDSPSQDPVIASKLRNLAPVAQPFTDKNRIPNAVRAAKKITMEYPRVAVTLSGNETVDLTATLLRIADGARDQHRNDGTEFRNRERLLPVRQSYYYTEFVHRVIRGSSPGAYRIIIGQEGDIWYTPDHYQSFIPVSNEARGAHLQQREIQQ